MSFDVPADAYDRFMGRFSGPLAPLFADAANVHGGRVVDVGCGPGALTRELLARGAQVSAADPSEQFVTAARAAYPQVDVQLAGAEELPFPDGGFDAALAQLVVQFMTDPVAGLAEMARVTRPGGVVAACVWDHGGRRGPLSPFWDSVHALDPAARDEAAQVGVSRGGLPPVFERAGLVDAVESDLVVSLTFTDFEDWWHPYTLGVGPPGDYLARLADPTPLREECRRRLGDPPFTVEAHAWCAVGRVSAAR